MKFALFPLVTVIFFSILTYSQASDTADPQIWDGIGVSKQLYPKFELAFDKEIRYKSGLHFKNFDKITLAANFDATQWLQLGVGYWRGQISSGTEWRKEQKPVLILKLKYNYPRLELSARHKLEYRIIQKYENIPIYKFRTQVKYNFKNNTNLSEAYINDEIFVNLNNDTLYLNRMRVGLKLKFDFVSPDINYVFQLSRKNGDLHTIQAFAIKVWLQF